MAGGKRVDGRWLLRFDDALGTAGGLDKPRAQLVKDLLEHLALFGGQVAAGLLCQQRQNLDHLRGAVEIRLAALARYRIGEIPEMDRRGAREREHEGGEGQ